MDAIREARPPFSPEQVVTEFAVTLKSFRVSRVAGDHYAGEWPREHYRKHGIIYEFAQRTKSDIYRDTLPLINSGRLVLLDHQKMIDQFCNLERRTSRAGKDSVDHGPGGHDDICNAVAGALLAASAGKKRRPLFGCYGYGGGPVTWWDRETGQEIDPRTLEPIVRPRIRFVAVPESLAPAARGKF